MHKVIIDPNRQKLSLNIKEVLEYKDLLYTLAVRDFKVRYAQTFLGFIWAAIQPLTTLLVFTLVFDKVAKVDTEGIPYPVFAMVGMCAWSYFAFVMAQAGNSIIGAQNMISKIYFPRLIIPLSKAMVGLVDLAINMVFVVVLMIIYKVPPSPQIALLPLFVFFAVLAGLTVGIWLSALTVRYRDFQHIIPFMVQVGMYATPVAYPASLVPEKYHLLYYLNPMAGVVKGFRWSLLGGTPPVNMVFVSMGVLVLLFFGGLLYFRKVERVMADIV